MHNVKLLGTAGVMAVLLAMPAFAQGTSANNRHDANAGQNGRAADNGGGPVVGNRAGTGWTGHYQNGVRNGGPLSGNTGAGVTGNGPYDAGLKSGNTTH